MKKLIRIILILLVVLVAAFFFFRTPDTDRAEMIAKYGSEASQFLDDGAGGKIHYRDEGNKNGPALVLIHGSNSHLQTWEPVVASLGDQYRLISLDLYGHGLTGPHPANDYEAQTSIDAVVKVLDAVGVEKAVWVGNSMGGWLSWRAGLAVPERVSGLVLIDASGAQVDEEGQLYIGARLARSSVGQMILPQLTPRFLIKASLEDSVANPEGLTDDLVDRYWELLRFPGNRKATLDRGARSRQPEKWKEIGTLEMPVLLLWGEQDKLFSMTHAQAFKEAIPGSKLISYADAGHLPMEETPEQVARDIAAWIETVTNAAESANIEQ